MAKAHFLAPNPRRRPRKCCECGVVLCANDRIVFDEDGYKCVPCYDVKVAKRGRHGVS